MALVQAVLACVFTVRRRGWRESSHISPAGEDKPAPEQGTARRKPPAAAALIFAAVETGIESGAGIWGYVFLTAGRGLAIGAVNARILAPSLLVLGLAMGGFYALLSRWSGGMASRPPP